MGDKLKSGAAMKAGNARFNARRSKRRAYEFAMKEAEQRALENDRQLQPSLKAECVARHPEWFRQAA